MAAELPDDSKFEAIRKSCLQTGKLWEDPEFPASDRSVFRNPKQLSGFIWKRPHEISKKTPRFFAGGASRFDIQQGGLGDCWMLAAAANLARFPYLFQRLVPPNQSFDKNWYAGVFHFRFWRYGEWTDVLVDDRLPTKDGKLVYVSSEAKNEFWGALLEKAFAKFYGSYEAIEGGNNADSLTDFTGGLVETFDLQTTPKNLSQILEKAVSRKSIMSAGIYGDSRRNPVLKTGLVSGHAYSVTGFSKAKLKDGSSVNLIRIRNPWGNSSEWNGRWSDSSSEWLNMSAEEKQKLELVKDGDGEFWMQLSDFIRNFHVLDICNLTPDDLTDQAIAWQVSTAHSEWKLNVTAGGRITSPLFHKNQQFSVKVEDGDVDADIAASFTVQVIQKNCRRRNIPYQTLGLVIYKCPPGIKPPLDKTYLSKVKPVEMVSQYKPQPAPCRMIVERFTEGPGNYIIIPTTWDIPDEDRQFMVRIFSENPHSVRSDS